MSGPRRIDLNADLGEETTDDSGLLGVVSSANVACGYHAGTPATMRAVCAEAAERGVAIGAHVSYADRAGFGRTPQRVAPDTLTEQVADQVGTLAAAARSAGVEVRYLKPHGALYHRVSEDAAEAEAVLEGVGRSGVGALPVLGLPGALILESAGLRGVEVGVEGFPDRGYAAPGRLIPRGAPGDVLHDATEIAAAAVELADQVDSVCVHGDTADAVRVAVAVRRSLTASGFLIQPWVDAARDPQRGDERGE